MRKMRPRDVLKFFVSALFVLVAALGSIAWNIVSKYQLPFHALPIITTFLGPIDFLASYRTAVGLSASRRASRRPLPPLLLFLNLLLLILPSVIIALGAPYIAGSRCQLRDTWQAWYSAKDGNAIKGVQESLQCCGFGKVTEEAYPFYKGPPKGEKKPEVPADACAKMFDRTTPCAPVWEDEMKRAAGLVVGAAAVTLVLKLVFLMVTLGNPKAAQKLFAAQRYDEYGDNRAIEEVDDDDEEGAEGERSAPHITTGERPSNEDGTNERTRLLLPKDHGSNGHRITMNEENEWRHS